MAHCMKLVQQPILRKQRSKALSKAEVAQLEELLAKYVCAAGDEEEEEVIVPPPKALKKVHSDELAFDSFTKELGSEEEGEEQG